MSESSFRDQEIYIYVGRDVEAHVAFKSSHITLHASQCFGAPEGPQVLRREQSFSDSTWDADACLSDWTIALRASHSSGRPIKIELASSSRKGHKMVMQCKTVFKDPQPGDPTAVIDIVLDGLPTYLGTRPH